MNKKQLENLTRNIRKTLPAYNNGRKVVVTHEYTKIGYDLLLRANVVQGVFLGQVYTTFSDEKREAHKEVLDMYLHDENAYDFHICSHTCQGFCVSWVNDIGVVYITPKTEYLIVTAD